MIELSPKYSKVQTKPVQRHWYKTRTNVNKKNRFLEDKRPDFDDRMQYRNVVGGGDTEQEKGGRCRDGEDGCREGEGGGVESGDF